MRLPRTTGKSIPEGRGTTFLGSYSLGFPLEMVGVKSLPAKPLSTPSPVEQRREWNGTCLKGGKRVLSAEPGGLSLLSLLIIS